MSPVAVVTGASGGVGRATARELARRGFDLGLIARGAAGLDGARRDVEAHGRRAVVSELDVADADAVAEAARRVEHELGPITVWVNDAMTTVFSPFAELTPDEFRRAIEVTFLGQVWGTMAALAVMRPRDHGSVVNVGSRSRSSGSLCRARTARRSSRAAASSSRCGPSSCTKAAT